MYSKEDLIKSPEYWFTEAQSEIFRMLSEYMENENLNQTQLAERLGVSKGYISQTLNGEFNCTLKKLIEMSLSIGVVPEFKYTQIDEMIHKSDFEGLRAISINQPAVNANPQLLSVSFTNNTETARIA